VTHKSGLAFLRHLPSPPYPATSYTRVVAGNTFMDKEIFKLREEIKSNVWETCLSAADRLADMGTEESVQLLVDYLQSNENFTRNAAALGLMRTGNQKYLSPLINRIKELGPQEEIGTLVYALESFDCNTILLDIVSLYLEGNFEVRQATTNILNEQSFQVTKKELEKIEKQLEDHDYALDSFKINYQINSE
jgi:hypothetical protein